MKIKLCEYCIDEVKSRGEMLYVGTETNHDESERCEWCNENGSVLYECIFE